MKMNIQLIILLIMVGLAAGMLSGLVGIGGGVIIVPALVFFVGLSQKSAQGTSLGLLMLPVGILGVINYYKQGYVDYKYIVLIAIGFVAGSYLGSKITLGLSDDKVKKIFAIIMMLLSIKMLFIDKPSLLKKKNKTEVNANK